MPAAVLRPLGAAHRVVVATGVAVAPPHAQESGRRRHGTDARRRLLTAALGFVNQSDACLGEMFLELPQRRAGRGRLSGQELGASGQSRAVRALDACSCVQLRAARQDDELLCQAGEGTRVRTQGCADPWSLSAPGAADQRLSRRGGIADRVRGLVQERLGEQVLRAHSVTRCQLEITDEDGTVGDEVGESDQPVATEQETSATAVTTSVYACGQAASSRASARSSSARCGGLQSVR